MESVKGVTMFIVKVPGPDDGEMVTLDHETIDGREITIFATREAAQELADQYQGAIIEEHDV